MTLALLLSGQGGQHPEMFALTAAHPLAEPIFAAATDVLGADPRALAAAGGEALHVNRTAQILCCTAALAGWAVVEAASLGRVVVAGYSVGDLAAWGVAGRLAPEDVLRLAAARAEAMDEAAPTASGLAGIRGLAAARTEALAGSRGCHLAIRNAPDSVVVGGPRRSLEALCAEAVAAGAARAVLLPVGIPSHTVLLRAATDRFRASLARVRFLHPAPGGPRLVSGLDGAVVFDAAAGADKLARQISQTIDWEACLDACREASADRVVEFGPGDALARMARGAMPDALVRSVDDFRSAKGLAAWVSSVRTA